MYAQINSEILSAWRLSTMYERSHTRWPYYYYTQGSLSMVLCYTIALYLQFYWQFYTYWRTATGDNARKLYSQAHKGRHRSPHLYLLHRTVLQLITSLPCLGAVPFYTPTWRLHSNRFRHKQHLLRSLRIVLSTVVGGTTEHTSLITCPKEGARVDVQDALQAHGVGKL